VKILRALADTLGCERTVREAQLAVIPLEGFDRWEHLEPFRWLVSELLDSAVDVDVLLDRDYRDDSAEREIVTRLDTVGVKAHMWERHELENYLLVPRAIARRPKRGPYPVVQSVLHRREKRRCCTTNDSWSRRH
jgi:hypothetical protein